MLIKKLKKKVILKLIDTFMPLKPLKRQFPNVVIKNSVFSKF